MKPEELSIGDWVNVLNYHYDGSPYVGQVDGITKKHGTYYLQFGSALSAEIDRCKPIPITPEILERNGFKKVPQPKCANPFHWELASYEDDIQEPSMMLYCIKAFTTLFYGMFISINVPSACETITFGKQVEYVHELQHALHLCKIEKEIEL